MKVRQVSMTAKDAILLVLRNGRPRHTMEIVERMKADHGWELSSQQIAALLRSTPGVVSDGKMYKMGDKCIVWRLQK